MFRSHGTNLKPHENFKRPAVQRSCEPSENIEQFRVNEVAGQIFLPVENSSGAVWVSKSKEM